MRRSLLNRAMSYKYNKKLIQNAQILRKNMTPEEKHLWYDFLKLLPLTVNRQKNIGNYILDFFIAEKRIAIEVDGSQHEEERKSMMDKKRDEDLWNIGIKVIRYSNKDINKNFIVVCEDLLKKLGLTVEDLRK